MIHVKRCPYGNRSNPITEFYKDGKPQIYCRGWIDPVTDEPLKVCQNCKDWSNGEQCENDFSKSLLH